MNSAIKGYGRVERLQGPRRAYGFFHLYVGICRV